MAHFQSNEIYKLYMYNRKTGTAEVFVDLLVLDRYGTIYLANMIGSDKDTKLAATLIQEGKGGQIFRAEGDKYEGEHIQEFVTGITFRKNFYDEEHLKLEDLRQVLMVAKNTRPDTKARNAWADENKRRIEEGLDPNPLPEELEELILAWDGDYKQKIYQVLDDRYNTPMLSEWKDYIVEECIERGYYNPLHVYLFGSDYKLEAGLLKITEEQLEEIITEGIQSYELDFAIEEDGRSKDEAILPKINTVDDYITQFGGELGKVIQKNVKVRFDPTKDKHHPAFYDMNLWANEHGITGLYPPQANTVMGVSKTLLEDDFCFVVGEMGVGKTLIGPASVYIAEAMFQKVENDPKPQRVIVLSPAIMVDKWCREVKDRIPNAKTFKITHWTDVKRIQEENQYIDKKGKIKYKKPETWEFYIMSAETPKFTYPMEPIKDWRSHKSEIPFMTLDEAPENKVRAIKRMFMNKDGKYVPAIHATVDPGHRIRFIKEEVENHATGRIYTNYVVGDSGYYCPRCGQPLKQRNGDIAGRNFFGKFNKSSGKWNKKMTKENWVCTNEVPTATLPKEEIREWRFDRTSNRWVPAYETQKCGFVLWQPEVLPLDSKHRKVSPAWYINKRLPRGFFKYLIADEVHEYKSGDSSVGQALGQLINHTEKQILLTGTLFGGMSKDIFYLLARLNPKALLKEGITYYDEAIFNDRYGVSEHSTCSNNSSNNNEGRIRVRKTKLQKPGINPHLFPMHLMRNCAFLELNDMGYALPPYQEIPVVVDMDSRQKEAYDRLASQIKLNMSRTDGLKGLSGASIFINSMYQYADAPFHCSEIVAYDRNGERHLLGAPQCFDPDAFVPPKVEELIRNIDKELYYPDPIVDRDGNERPSPKRKSLVYVRFTGKDAFTQMDTYLYDLLKRRGYNVGILRSSGSYDGIKMPRNSRERETWLNEMMEKYDWDILITNPRLVKVGLDLLAFPNIHFFQMDYSTFDYLQASRRSWRIKQTLPVKVFTYVYKDTIQEKALQHIAKKIDASLAIQGKFSEEGLRAMADSTDGFNALAKQLMEDDILKDVETVHDIFERKNQTFEEMQSVEFQEYDSYVMNPIEGGIETVRKIAEGLIKKVEEAHRAGRATAEEIELTRKVVSDYLNLFDELMETVENVKAYNKGVPKKKQVIEGQTELDLFALV